MKNIKAQGVITSIVVMIVVIGGLSVAITTLNNDLLGLNNVTANVSDLTYFDNTSNIENLAEDLDQNQNPSKTSQIFGSDVQSDAGIITRGFNSIRLLFSVPDTIGAMVSDTANVTATGGSVLSPPTWFLRLVSIAVGVAIFIFIWQVILGRLI